MSFCRENHSFEATFCYKKNVLKTKEHLLKSCILKSRLDINERNYTSSRKNHTSQNTLDLISRFQIDISRKNAEVNSDNNELKIKAPPSPQNDDKKITAAEQRYKSIQLKTSTLLCKVKEIEKDSNIDSLRLKIRVEINKKVGQISCLSSQVRKISCDLTMLFNECWRKYGHDFLLYCLYVFAEKIVDQAEKLLGIHVESSYPYASVISSMIKDFSDLEVILAYVIYSRYPLAIPLHLDEITQFPLNSNSKQLIQYGENETLEEFLERNAGVISLLGAIFCMSDSSLFSTSCCWMLLANYLNFPPTKISAHILCSLVEVSGYALSLHYKAYFGQLITCIKTKFIPKLPKDCAAISTRLDILVSTYFSNNPPSFPVPNFLKMLSC